MLISKSTYMGNLLSHPIYRIDELEYIDISHPMKISLTPTTLHSKMIEKYKKMINKVLQFHSLYVGIGLDLTLSMQNLFLGRSMDQRFCFNLSYLEVFANTKKFTQFILPVIHGYIQVICILYI